MISSEVQRTLVKSPPELWTELSDPASLSRHLGEFGDIRITRVEPEKTVEWEADNATGTVAIKPSGWGTRVTLTVTRELPPPEQPQNTDAATEPAATEPAPPAAPEPGDPVTAESEPSAGPEPEPHGDVDPQPPGAIQVEDWAPDGDFERESEPDPPVAVEAEQWDDAGWEYETEPDVEPEPAPEPRRGFLARLFRRRREPVVDERLDPHGSAPSDEVTDEWSAEEAPAEAARDWQQPAKEHVNQLQPATAAAAAAAAATTAAAAAAATESATHEPAQADWEQPPGDGEQADELRAPRGEGEQGDEQQPHGEGEQAGEEQPADISAELGAAEEIAAEEVTALLTSMLDRLGTAHHRPFSRA